MIKLELTRWATYLVPGSIMLLGACLLWASVAGYSIPKALCSIEKKRSVAFIVFAFSVASYIVGIGHWGICYIPAVQDTLFAKPCEKRVKWTRHCLTDPWRQEKYYATLKGYFPDLPESKKDPNNFEYCDFSFVVLAIYQDGSDAVKDRLIWQRETIGLLQSLILSCLFLSVVLAVLATLGIRRGNRALAIRLYIASGLTLCVTAAMYVHYLERNYYLVRDAILAFLSMDAIA